MTALALAPMAPTGADPTSITTTADRAGYWAASQGVVPTSGTPLNGVLPPIPTSPTVPTNSLPVTAVAGQPQYESGIGISFSDPGLSGATINKLTMTLDPAPSGQQNDSTASLLACPITVSGWVDVKNGKWSDKPAADCTKAAKGKRNSDGSWTFDLVQVASLWTDPFSANGVLLEPGDATSTFQVAFKDIASGGVHIDSDIKGNGNADASFAAPISVAPDNELGGGLTSSPLTPSVGAPLPPAAPVSPNAPRQPSRPTIQRVARVGRASGNLANLSLWLLLLVPIAFLAVLGAAAATNHRPAPDAPRRRQGGVGRALQRPASRSTPELP